MTTMVVLDSLGLSKIQQLLPDVKALAPEKNKTDRKNNN